MKLAFPALAFGWLLLLASGCSEGPSDPAKLTSQENEIIGVARRAVEQYEDWAGQAEYQIERHQGGWKVTAWKVVHPDAKGNQRYVPWGRSTILIDERLQVAEYRHGK